MTTNTAGKVFNRILGDRKGSAAGVCGGPGFKLPGFKTPQPAFPSLPVPSIEELPLLIAALKAPAKPARPGAPLVTLVVPVLDKSSSMRLGLAQTIKSYNEQQAELRKYNAQIGMRITQVNFNTANEVVAQDIDAGSLVPLSHETYVPEGGTALYDTAAAVVKMILAHPLAHDDNTSILLPFTTDGEDLNSVVWKTPEMDALHQLMKAVSENERWTVTLAGPNRYLRQLASVMCVSEDNLAAFDPDDEQSRAMAGTSSVQAMGAYGSLRAGGTKKVASVYAGTVAGAMAKDIMGKQS